MIEILKIKVYSRPGQGSAYQVTAKNAKGEIIHGHTPLDYPPRLSVWLEEVIKKMDETQSHYAHPGTDPVPF